MEKALEHFMCATASVSAVNLWLGFKNEAPDNLILGCIGLGLFAGYVYIFHHLKDR